MKLDMSENNYKVLFLYPNSIRKKFNSLKNVKTKVLLKNNKTNSNRLYHYYYQLVKYLTFFKFSFSNKDINLVVINSRIGSY